MKTVWTFIGFTLILFISALTAFPLSVYLGRGTKDPDAYEFLGWFGSLGLLFLAGVFGIITLGMWMFQRNKSKKLVEGLKL